MKRFTSLVVGCSLALAGAALAQQPEQQDSPAKKNRRPEQSNATEAKPSSNAGNTQERPARQNAKERGSANEHGTMNGERGAANAGAANERAAGKAHPGRANAESTGNTDTRKDASAQPSTSAAPETAKPQQAEQHRKGMKGERRAAAKASATPAASAAAGASATPAAASASAAPPAGVAGQQNARTAAAAKKPAPQQIQQIKQQHASFRAQPKPEQVPTVTYNQNYRIQGAEQWQGPQYEVFRSYQPGWHDAGWYQSNYGQVQLIGGGYYYLNNGYWFPAWGYSQQAQYYPYDGPIYVGHRSEPPDRVIADVQTELQQMGYYRGEVDGLLGPLTREALTAYQSDQGLARTAAIDEPTLDSLGMG